MSLQTIVMTNNSSNVNLYDNFVNIFFRNIFYVDPNNQTVSTLINLSILNNKQCIEGKVIITDKNRAIGDNETIYEKKQLMDYETAINKDPSFVANIAYILSKYPMKLQYPLTVTYNGANYMCDSYVNINNNSFYVLNLMS